MLVGPGEVKGFSLFSTETWTKIVFHGPDKISRDEGMLGAFVVIYFVLAGFWFEGQ